VTTPGDRLNDRTSVSPAATGPSSAAASQALLATESVSPRPRVLTALPVFNEERHVVDVLAEVQRYAENILVVDDGSSDRTAELLATIPGIAVERHAVNQGYGAALRTAFAYALKHGFDVLVTIDCDGQHQPRLIPELAAAVFPPSGDVIDLVSGSRYLAQLPGASTPPVDRRRINLEITEYLNRELELNLTDAFCGFKAYHVPALARLQITETGYAMPLQLWVQAVNAGWKIVEFAVPLIYLEEERSFGGSLDDAQRRLAHYYDVLCREFRRLQRPCGAC
jgi:glycosyltransferase involved in cell wall biosynthesis